MVKLSGHMALLANTLVKSIFDTICFATKSIIALFLLPTTDRIIASAGGSAFDTLVDVAAASAFCSVCSGLNMGARVLLTGFFLILSMAALFQSFPRDCKSEKLIEGFFDVVLGSVGSAIVNSSVPAPVLWWKLRCEIFGLPAARAAISGVSKPSHVEMTRLEKAVNCAAYLIGVQLSNKLSMLWVKNVENFAIGVKGQMIGL